VDYAEIAPWLRKAEKYMGVASTVQNRPSNPDGEYLPRCRGAAVDYIIQKGAERIGVPYLPEPVRATYDGAQRASGLPLLRELQRGCDVGHSFHRLGSRSEAEATKNLDAADECAGAKRAWDENGMATGVAYVDRTTKKGGGSCEGDVLAASCVETAHIMLNSKSWHWPTGIANSSADNWGGICAITCYGCPGYGYLPQLLGQPASRIALPIPRSRDAALQNLDESAGGEIYRGYSCIWAEDAENFRALQPTRRIGRNSNATSSATTHAGWGADSGAFAAESDELRGH